MCQLRIFKHDFHKKRKKIFTKISSTHEAICRCDVSSQYVAATCRLVCTDLNNFLSL